MNSKSVSQGVRIEKKATSAVIKLAECVPVSNWIHKATH